MDFAFKSSFIGRSRGSDADAWYYWVPAGTVGHLNTDKKDDLGADAPELQDWPTLVAQTGVAPNVDGTFPQVAAPAPGGVVLALDVQAYRIKAVAGPTDLGGRLAASAEQVTLFVGDHLVTAANSATGTTAPGDHPSSSRRA